MASFSGIFLVVGFALLAPVMDTFAKLAASTIPVGEVVFARFFLQAILLSPFYLLLRLFTLPTFSKLVFQFARAGCIVGSTLCFYSALRFMPIADALAIFFVEPFILIIFARIILGESISWKKLLACVLGFSGAFLVIGPMFSGIGWISLLPLGTATFFALYMILTRYMSDYSHPISMQISNGVAGSVIMIVLTLSFMSSDVVIFQPVWPVEKEWGFLLGVGFSGAVSHLLLTYGLKRLPAVTAAPLQYFEIVGACLLGYFIFEDIPGVAMVFGVLIIISAGLFVVYTEAKTLTIQK